MLPSVWHFVTAAQTGLRHPHSTFLSTCQKDNQAKDEKNTVQMCKTARELKLIRLTAGRHLQKKIFRLLYFLKVKILIQQHGDNHAICFQVLF